MKYVHPKILNVTMTTSSSPLSDEILSDCLLLCRGRGDTLSEGNIFMFDSLFSSLQIPNLQSVCWAERCHRLCGSVGIDLYRRQKFRPANAFLCCGSCGPWQMNFSACSWVTLPFDSLTVMDRVWHWRWATGSHLLLFPDWMQMFSSCALHPPQLPSGTGESSLWAFRAQEPLCLQNDLPLPRDYFESFWATLT